MSSKFKKIAQFLMIWALATLAAWAISQLLEIEFGFVEIVLIGFVQSLAATIASNWTLRRVQQKHGIE